MQTYTRAVEKRGVVDSINLLQPCVVLLIGVYQILISPLLHAITGQDKACRYAPTCSEYAKEQIIKYGLMSGGRKALIRLLSCQPFSKAAI